jgi:ABC-type transport system substrate-binding protein
VIPGAGPYYVASYTPGQGVVVRRNPNYHGSRPHHFGRILLAVGVPAPRAFGEIEAGSADYTDLGWYTTPRDRCDRIAARRPLWAWQSGGRTRPPAVVRQSRC